MGCVSVIEGVPAAAMDCITDSPPLLLSVHNGSSFLPCHRLFSLSWVNALRSQCNYRGPILYGDWPTYADKGEYFTSTDLWGEENLGSLTCPVKGGRFENWWFRYVGSSIARATVLYWYPHQLCRKPQEVSDRGINYQRYFTTETINAILSFNDFQDMRYNLEVRSHNAMHRSTGGDLMPSTSPYDAAWFFLNHIFYDCLWAKWQNQNDGANRAKYDGFHPGEEQVPVTIHDTCPMMGIGKDTAVIDLLNTNAPPNCYACAGM
ncbi:hypothetical protein CBS101457_006710 [Exobasidium rhododendri]|nr:hypothetical protein CBS101457_006710 [Exobasidium rhododendri]